ncbi:hypothetical protein [Algibacter sp. 2305UL17-15]|uniref:DUF350 domain-containing protein n=1 Tax=Algibacter sp. 2305UL17-15 TaxID=3231268 RepID=UPI003457AAD1
MEQHVFKMGLIQFCVFLLISVLTLLVTLWFIKRFISKKYHIEDYNTAYGIFTGGLVISVFYIISGLITPIISTLKLLDNISGSWMYILESAKHISVLLLVAMVSAFIICFLAIKLSKRFFIGLIVFNEIKNNRIGIAVFVAVILIAFSLVLRDSLQLLFDSFVPYPEMPNFLN